MYVGEKIMQINMNLHYTYKLRARDFVCVFFMNYKWLKNVTITVFSIGRKKSVIIGVVIAFIASAISVAIPTNKSSGKYTVFYDTTGG